MVPCNGVVIAAVSTRDIAVVKISLLLMLLLVARLSDICAKLRVSDAVHNAMMRCDSALPSGFNVTSDHRGHRDG